MRRESMVHKFNPDRGEATDHAGRLPCRRCGVLDWDLHPQNDMHANYVEPDGDRSDAILGEHDADAA